jgi:hypothetical protein
VKLSQVLFGKQKAKIDTTHKESKAPLFLVGGVTLFSGVGEMYVLRKYFDIIISVHLSDFITYGIYVSIGYLVYKFIITKDVKALKFLRHYQLGFRKANIILVLFLMLTMAFIY